MSNLSSPVPFSHLLWKQFIKKGAHMIDATCGNGKDTSFLANTFLTQDEGKLYAFDIQKSGIENTQKQLKDKLKENTLQAIELICACHSQIDDYVYEKIDLIVFNLGYLPHGDKGITTLTSTTLIALKKALLLLNVNGILSITCYPGHSEGAKETEHVLNWAQNLSSNWTVTKHTWVNRSKDSPLLLLILKNR